MKKKTLFLGAFVAVLFSFSCKKDLEKNPFDDGKETPVTKNGSLSPGAMHNALTDAYISAHGLVYDPELTYDEVYDVTVEVAHICKSLGYFDPETDEAEVAGALMAHAGTIGFFENGILKPADDVNDIMAQKVENSSIRAAFLQIDALDKQDIDGFDQKSQQILAALSQLNTTERTGVDGYGSVSGGSLVLWVDKKPLSDREKLITVVKADARAFYDGFTYGMSIGLTDAQSLRLAICFSASISISAARQLFHQ